MRSATKASPPLESQWAILAALRFFLSASVVFGHFSLYVRTDHTRIFGDGYLNPGSAVFGFFILSGFSIAASVARETDGFYARRVVRIWPLYLSAIVFGLVVSALLVPHGAVLPLGLSLPREGVLQTVASLLMLQTIVTYAIPTVAPIWSLSAEWWHYMISPILKRLSNALLAVWVIASFIAYLMIQPSPGHGIDALPHGLAIVVSSWMWVTGFLYYRLRGTPIGFVVLALPSTFALTLGHFTGAPLFISIFVLVVSSEIRLPAPLIQKFNFLGDYSYPLYLFHWPAFIAALALGSNRSATTLGAAFLVSLIALYAIDFPARRQFRKRRTAQTVAV
ncbi:acyltransferase family protein [Paraburkholderia tropica]|uniref:acyltransferase family protein n=1 Tax=Paraburkholderia tropica TaxID=92647 RepID=UPI002AB17AB9|nr:acyltransferase [Paraburkholderia tropica]